MRRKPSEEVYAIAAVLLKRLDPEIGFLALEDLKEKNPSKATSDRLAYMLANIRFSTETNGTQTVSEQEALEAVVAYHHGPLQPRAEGAQEYDMRPPTDLAPYLTANRLLTERYGDAIDEASYAALCAGAPDAATLNRLYIVRHDLTDASPADRAALDIVLAHRETGKGAALS